MIAPMVRLLGRWFAQPDKVLHYIVGALLALVMLTALVWYGLSRPAAGAATLAAGMLVAYGKEWADKGRAGHTWDGWDAFATLSGAVCVVGGWLVA